MPRPLLLTISDHPIVTEAIVLSLRAQLALASSSTLARLAVRAADALIAADTMAAHGLMHAYAAAPAAAAETAKISRPRGAACASYDPETGLIWGYGDNLGRCMADAGWSTTEAGCPEIMGRLLTKRADPVMAELLAEWGPALGWTIDTRGVIVPDDGISIPDRNAPIVQAAPVPVYAVGEVVYLEARA